MSHSPGVQVCGLVKNIRGAGFSVELRAVLDVFVPGSFFRVELALS